MKLTVYEQNQKVLRRVEKDIDHIINLIWSVKETAPTKLDWNTLNELERRLDRLALLYATMDVTSETELMYSESMRRLYLGESYAYIDI